VTPLYPQKLALTSPTGGGRSVGIVRSRTKATEFSLEFITVYKALGRYYETISSPIAVTMQLIRISGSTAYR